MAYSSVTTDMKQEVVKHLLSCDLFVDALDAQGIKDKDDLVGTHIFTYPLNPEYLQESKTFITVSVQVPKVYSDNKIWVHPILEFHIVSHVDHMKIDPKQIKTSSNRNDFISQIIDRLFNKNDTSKNKFGFFGQLETIRNEEGVFNKDWVYRYISFETLDLNKALCERSNEMFFGKYGYEVPESLR